MKEREMSGKEVKALVEKVHSEMVQLTANSQKFVFVEKRQSWCCFEPFDDEHPKDQVFTISESQLLVKNCVVMNLPLRLSHFTKLIRTVDKM